jgi:hypothetical protein
MAARAATTKLKALHASSTDSSVSADDDRDNELKLAREAAREQAAHWAAAHPRGTVAAALTGADVPAALWAGARAAAVSPTAAAAQTGVDASATGLTESESSVPNTVNNASLLKNIESKLMLSEEEPVWLMLYGDSQKMMEGSKILHDEFPLEGRYGLLQKCCAGCGEDNVINVKQ